MAKALKREVKYIERIYDCIVFFITDFEYKRAAKSCEHAQRSTKKIKKTL